MCDVLVIGAGLGGLLCGRILSQRGLHVTILEAQDHPGGLLQGFPWEGVWCEQGFHSVGGLGAGEPLEKVFRSLGLMDLPWYKADADEGFPFLRLNGDSAWEKEHIVSPYKQSVWRLKGGGKSLVKELCNNIVININNKVTNIDNHVVTCGDGSSYQAETIISSLPPLVTLSLLKDPVRKSYGHRLAHMDRGPSMFTVHCLLEPGCVPWQSASIFLDGELMLHFDEPETHVLELICFGKGEPDAMMARARQRFPGLKVQKYRTTVSPGYGPIKNSNAECISPVTPLPWLFLTGQEIGLHGILGTAVSALNTCKSLEL